MNDMTIRTTTAKATSNRRNRWVQDPVAMPEGLMVVVVMVIPLSPWANVPWPCLNDAPKELSAHLETSLDSPPPLPTRHDREEFGLDVSGGHGSRRSRGATTHPAASGPWARTGASTARDWKPTMVLTPSAKSGSVVLSTPTHRQREARGCHTRHQVGIFTLKASRERVDARDVLLFPVGQFVAVVHASRPTRRSF